MVESQKKTKRFNTRLSITKLAFLSVFVLMIAVFIRGWMDGRWTKTSTETSPLEDRVTFGRDSYEIFLPVLPKLYPKAFFGVNELENGRTITVAGFVGEEVEEEGQKRLELFPFIGEEEKTQIFIVLSEEDSDLTVTKNGISKTQSWSKTRKAIKNGTPVAVTVFFDRDFEYLNVSNGLEDINDYLILGNEIEENEKVNILLPSSSFISIDLL